MNEPFLAHWFQGFDLALSEMDEHSADTLMAHCGRACSDSYPKQVYMEQYRKAADLDDFLARLARVFEDTTFRRIGPDEIEIVYAACGCDLVRGGFLRSPKLCQCSLKSLRYNWEAVLGENSVACRMEQSILRGDDRCRFVVNLLRGDLP